MACRIVSGDEMACFIKNENMIVVDTRPSTMLMKYHIENSMSYSEFLTFSENNKDLSIGGLCLYVPEGTKATGWDQFFQEIAD